MALMVVLNFAQLLISRSKSQLKRENSSTRLQDSFVDETISSRSTLMRAYARIEKLEGDLDTERQLHSNTRAQLALLTERSVHWEAFQVENTRLKAQVDALQTIVDQLIRPK